jgi:2-hydroxychromene-2-carboxylate isomerase
MDPPEEQKRSPWTAAGALADAQATLVVFDLQSVETYLLSQPLGWLAPEDEGAAWCPLPSAPSALDLNCEARDREAHRLELPIVWPEHQPVPVPRAMRVAALAAARGCAARYVFAMSRIAYGGGGDINDPQQCLLAANETGLDKGEVQRAGEPSSEWDVALSAIKTALQGLGILTAPTVRWQGDLYTGFRAIRGLLRETETNEPD